MAFSRSKMRYGNYLFLPTPLFSWNTEMVKDAKGEQISLKHTLDFTGTMLVEASESGQLDAVLLKRKGLQEALASGHQKFSITYDGSPVLDNIYPRVNNVNFEEGVWVDRINYTFQMEYDENFNSTAIQSYNETWGFEESEDRRSVTARHDVSAIGINTAGSGTNNAFTNARTFVLGRTGYSNVVAGSPAFVQVSGTYSAYEELRSEQVDSQAGSFSVSETYTLSSGNAIHTNTGQFQIDDNGVGTVTIDGTIRGLGRGDNAYSRAFVKWNSVKNQLAGIASGIYIDFGGGGTLFTSDFNNFSITRNPFAGTVTYNVSYTDSLSDNLPSGIKEFGITVNDQEPVRVYASFAIPERSLGNVVQDVATSTEGTFTISGNGVAKAGFDFNNLLAYIEDRVNALRPQSIDYITLRLSSKQLTKDIDNNTASFTFTWNYTKDLSDINDPTGDIQLV